MIDLGWRLTQAQIECDDWWPSGVQVPYGEHTMLVTPEGDDMWTIGVYRDTESAGFDPLAARDVHDDAIVAVITYLVNAVPDGVDWLAWACQRLDDGIEL
jgi:hypothetical protein